MRTQRTENEQLMPVVEAAAIIGCIRNNVYEFIKNGRLEAIEVDGRKMLRRDAVEAFAQKRKAAKAASSTAVLATGTAAVEPGVVVSPATGRRRAKRVAGPPPGTEAPSPADLADVNVGGSDVEERKALLGDIQFDEALQVRMDINKTVVADYADRMREGERFPAVQLFRDVDGKLYIGDGWHRLLAARSCGYASFPAIINPGGRSAALKFALSANSTHGLPRTNEDKLRAIAMGIKEYPNISNRELGRICAVSEAFVRNHRKGCERNAPEARVGGDGKLYGSYKSTKSISDPATIQALAAAKAKKACVIIGGLSDPQLTLVKQAVEKRIEQLANHQTPPPPPSISSAA